MCDTLSKGEMVLRNAELRQGRPWDDNDSAERDYLFFSGEGFVMELFIARDNVIADIFDDFDGNVIARRECSYKGYDGLVAAIGAAYDRASSLGSYKKNRN